MKNLVVLGAFGLGYAALQRVLVQRPKFSGRVAEWTELIAWNTTLMQCVQKLYELASDEEIVHVLEQLEKIRLTSQSQSRSSSWTLQQQISLVNVEIVRLASRFRGSTVTNEELITQSSLLEDVVPIIEEVLQNIQHNHMLDSLGP